MVSKIWIGCLLLIFIYFNSKFKVTCRNGDFECWYIRTYSKEKLSKISNITFTDLPFSHWNTLTAILSTYFGDYFFWWNHQMGIKMVHFNQNNAKSTFNLKCVTYTQPYFLSLMFIDIFWGLTLGLKDGRNKPWIKLENCSNYRKMHVRFTASC